MINYRQILKSNEALFTRVEELRREKSLVSDLPPLPALEPITVEIRQLDPEIWGASAIADQALVSDEAAARLRPSGFDPSRGELA